MNDLNKDYVRPEWTYLQENFEPIERCRAGPRDGTRKTTGGQMPPPHTALHFALREVIRYVQIFAYIQILKVNVKTKKGSAISTAVNAVPWNGTHS